MSSQRILLVDDQRETSRMLRLMLEYLNRGYVIVEVPSGEEALLEVRRGPFDLLITDVRLPGISGLELVGRMRKANPEARVIVISGLPGSELREAARELEADAFFPKPIETEEFLAAVQTMLGDVRPPEPAPARPAEPAEPDESDESEPQASQVSERLLLLRRDLGALAVFLADADGRVLLNAGDVARLDMPGLLNHLMVAFSAGLKTGALLGNVEPANLQFFDGQDYDVYTISAGQSYLLIIVFDGERGARAMGPVMSYGRPCAEDLRVALSKLEPEQAPARTGPLRPAPPPPAPAVEPLAVAEPALEALLQQASGLDANAFWEAALAEDGGDEADVNSLSYEQAQTLGLLPKNPTG